MINNELLARDWKFGFKPEPRFELLPAPTPSHDSWSESCDMICGAPKKLLTEVYSDDSSVEPPWVEPLFLIFTSVSIWKFSPCVRVHVRSKLAQLEILRGWTTSWAKTYEFVQKPTHFVENDALGSGSIYESSLYTNYFGQTKSASWAPFDSLGVKSWKLLLNNLATSHQDSNIPFPRPWSWGWFKNSYILKY